MSWFRFELNTKKKNQPKVFELNWIHDTYLNTLNASNI